MVMGKTASTLNTLTCGGVVASWLVRSSLDQEVWGWTLGPRDTVLRSWARHLTLTVPLSTRVYTCKWVPCNGLTSHPGGGGGGRNTSWYRNQDKLQPDGPLRSFADFHNLPTLNYHVFQLCQRVKQQPKTKTFLLWQNHWWATKNYMYDLRSTPMTNTYL